MTGRLPSPATLFVMITCFNLDSGSGSGAGLSSGSGSDPVCEFEDDEDEVEPLPFEEFVPEDVDVEDDKVPFASEDESSDAVTLLDVFFFEAGFDLEADLFDVFLLKSVFCV